MSDIQITYFGMKRSNILIVWVSPNGFGTIQLTKKNNKLILDDEHMGKEFCKQLLCQLVDDAEVRDD